MADVNEELLDAACFLGDTLGPLFLYDPADALVAPLYEQLAMLDPKAAAADWPLVNPAAALPALDLMVGSLDNKGEVAPVGAGEGAGASASASAGAGLASNSLSGEAASLDCDNADAVGLALSDALVWEYRRLFVGPAAKAAPPWGSVYTDRECVIFGRSTLALREWLRHVGVDFLGKGALEPAGVCDREAGAPDGAVPDMPAHGVPASEASVAAVPAPDDAAPSATDAPDIPNPMSNEPEDHIGLMLLLMSWLARNRPELLSEYLSEHLLTWAPHFLQLVQSQAAHPFFKGLGQLTELSLAGLEGALQLKVSIPRFYR